MKRVLSMMALAFFLCSIFAVVGSAEEGIVVEYPALEPLVDFVGEEDLSVLHLVGFRASEAAMDELGFERNSRDILALTDAGYIAEIGDYTSEKALDGVTLTTGNSRGKGNLVNVHKPYNAKLWFAFFDRGSGDCVYLEADGEVLETYLGREGADRGALRDFMELRDEKIFTNIAVENIDADKLLSDPEPWQKKMKAKVFGGNEFSLITLSNLWAEGLPNDFLKVAELHDHICPGLTSGYLIAEYVKKELPSSNPRNEYTIIAIPPWCKDDVFIQIFETNVGHKRLFVKWLTNEQKERLPEEAKNVANIFIREDKKTGKGQGIVVAFDWDKTYQLCGNVSRKDLKAFDSYRWWYMRLKMDLFMMDYLDKPQELISTLKEFTVDSPAEIEKLKAAGVNPLVELGIMEGEEVIEPEADAVSVVPDWIYALVLIILLLAVVVYYMRRG